MLLILSAQLPPWAQWPAVILALLSTGALAIKVAIAWWDKRVAKVAKDVEDRLHGEATDKALEALRTELRDGLAGVREELAEVDRKVDALATGTATLAVAFDGMRRECAAWRGGGAACGAGGNGSSDPSTGPARIRSVTPARGLPVGVPTPADVPPVAAEKR